MTIFTATILAPVGMLRIKDTMIPMIKQTTEIAAEIITNALKL